MTTKTYTFQRAPTPRITVQADGHPPAEVALRTDVRKHSLQPNWGYPGSGPSQTALAVLYDFLGERHAEVIGKLYMSFKDEVIATHDEDEWTLPQADIEQWFSEAGIDLQKLLAPPDDGFFHSHSCGEMEIGYDECPGCGEPYSEEDFDRIEKVIRAGKMQTADPDDDPMQHPAITRHEKKPKKKSKGKGKGVKA